MALARQTFDHDSPSAPTRALGMLLGASGVTLPPVQTIGILTGTSAADGSFNDPNGFGHIDYDNAAVSLTGATCTMYITDGTTTISLTCTKDADQSTETGDTGKGWYAAAWADDNADVATVAGRRRTYHTKILLGDGTTVLPHFKGKIDVGS